MRFAASRQLSEDYRRAVEDHAPWPGDAREPRPILVGDVAGDAALAALVPLFRQEGIGALASFPLVTGDHRLGELMVHHPRPHHYTDGEIEHATAIAHHLASATARFRAVARLEETIRYNDLFAGVLAHDLRNPLNAIFTAAQLLLMRQEGAGDRNARPVSHIMSSSQRMARMIDQLLDVTRARIGGGIELEPGAADLADLCDHAIGELELANPEWRIERSVRGDVSGSWDSDRVIQVVSNLVSNAAQHGRAGAAVRVELDGREDAQVKLHVHNAGTIPRPLLPTLFDPFRGASSRRTHSRGLGLGLFIVNEIVRGHGGSIDVASSEADGTTVTVCLPR